MSRPPHPYCSALGRCRTLALLGAAALLACGSTDREPRADGAVDGQAQAYTETGDLDALRARGKLRILLLNEAVESNYLPRGGSIGDFELRYATEFARDMGLEPVVVFVSREADFIPALTEGRGDVIATKLAITDTRKALIDFTVPVMHARQVVLKRAGDEISEQQHLAGRTIAVRASSPYWPTAQQLAASHQGLKVETLEEDLSAESKFELLSRGAIDLTLHDDFEFDVAVHRHDEISVAFAVTQEHPMAWGVRRDSPQLKEALDRFLNQQQLVSSRREKHSEDFDGIKKRRTLRVVTRNNAATYFLWRGELLGFEYEMAKAFAKAHKLRLEVLVAPEWERMLPMLLEGEADIAAAFLTPTGSRRKLGVEFSRSYSTASEVVVANARDEALSELGQLAGRTLVVRRSSSYWQTLEPLAATLGFTLQAAPEDEETETIIAKVASGEYDLTLADSNILDIELTWRNDVRAAFPIGDPIEHGWAVRKGNPQLLAEINAFFDKQYRSTFYNLTYAKYFKSANRIRRHKEERLDLNPDGTVSRYDEIVRRFADQYGFDWRMILAQIYHESRFDPNAKSWAGARGLLQVLPRTARQIGIEGNLVEPEVGIHAGIKYLAWVRERFEPELPVQDRMWFTLAGYNAGAGHVRDARRLARQMGWNSRRWFGNVEQAMLLLSKRKYARKAAHGYVRGSEPVAYVRQIKQRYDAYVRLTGAIAVAQSDPVDTSLSR